MNYFDVESGRILMKGIDEIPENAIAIDEELCQSIIDARMSGEDVFVDNGKVIIQPPKPSDDYDWSGSAWVLNAEQQAVKKAKNIAKVREAINTLRDKKINGGVYVPAIDKWIDSDARAERNLLSTKASFDLFGDELDITWTCADNTTIKLTKETMLHIWQALLHNKQTNHANAFLHKNAVDQSENPLEYDFSGGWTQTYEDVVAQSTEVVNG